LFYFHLPIFPSFHLSILIKYNSALEYEMKNLFCNDLKLCKIIIIIYLSIYLNKAIYFSSKNLIFWQFIWFSISFKGIFMHNLNSLYYICRHVVTHKKYNIFFITMYSVYRLHFTRIYFNMSLCFIGNKAKRSRTAEFLRNIYNLYNNKKKLQ